MIRTTEYDFMKLFSTTKDAEDFEQSILLAKSLPNHIDSIRKKQIPRKDSEYWSFMISQAMLDVLNFGNHLKTL